MTHVRWVARICLLVLTVGMLLAAALLPVRSAAQVQPLAVRGGAAMTPFALQQTTSFLVSLRDDGTLARAEAAQSMHDLRLRRRQINTLLQERASRNAAALQAFLVQEGLQDAVHQLQVFKSFNGFTISAPPAVIERLQRWAQVRAIEPEPTVQIEPLLPAPTQAQIDAVGWNIHLIGADRAQTELGVTGRGAVVGSLDTGVRFTHEALRDNYKCAGMTNHAACWLDALHGQPVPYDDYGHGTATLSVAVGRGGVGVAPDAQWIACKAYGPNGGNTGAFLACFDWFLAPGGDPANAPDVVINSWVWTDPVFTEPITHWINAGIAPIFANGNTLPLPGSQCNSVSPPARLPAAIGIGATDNTDTITWFSNRGPSPTGAIKPDLVAPGINIPAASSRSDTSYANDYYGTSFAAPHVVGLAALMRSANAQLTVDELVALMKATALPIATTACSSNGTPNNVYGWGRIRAFEAVRAALTLTLTAPAARTAPIGTQVVIPLQLTSDPQVLDVRAWATTLSVDPSVLRFVSATSDGTLSAGWSVTTNDRVPGRLVLNAYGTSPLRGRAPLINLTFAVVGTPGSRTALTLSDVLFNEGRPFAALQSGDLTVSVLTLSGTVRYTRSGLPIPNAILTAHMQSGTTRSAISDAAGRYAVGLTDLTATTVMITKTGDVRSSLSALDAAWIAQYDAGLRTFTPEQIDACDMSGNGSCTTFDASLLASYLIGAPQPGSQVGSWRFTPPQRSYPLLDQDLPDERYVGVVRGDVTTNWGTSSLQTAGAPRANPIAVALAPLGTTTEVPVFLHQAADRSILGYVLTISYDPDVLTVQGVEEAGSLSAGWSVLVNNASAGQLTILAYGTQPLQGAGRLLTLSVTSRSSGATSALLQVARLQLNEEPAIEQPGSDIITLGEPVPVIYLPFLRQ